MLKRDTLTGKIISYTLNSGVENEGSLDIAVIDGRFLRSEFNRVIDTKFKTLTAAVNAENVVLNKIKKAQVDIMKPTASAILPLSIDVTKLTPAQLKELAKQNFLSNIANLIDENGSSPASYESKLNNMQEQLVTKDSIISQQIQTISKFDDVLSSVSAERALAVAKTERLRAANVALQRHSEEKLTRIQNEVIAQREESKKSSEALRTALVDNISATNTKQDVDIEQIKLQNLQLQQNLQDTNTAIANTNNAIANTNNA